MKLAYEFSVCLSESGKAPAVIYNPNFIPQEYLIMFEQIINLTESEMIAVIQNLEHKNIIRFQKDQDQCKIYSFV
ncbi:hypothetical protein AHMF7605_02195 [Adhaeribacter arboris]|uniref:Uncharacterized protein n=1 Tax=Adhaeribacter arboris TaxID=2072846 RepID=A0A2T2YAA4_9BACT|nr:hypothetical protein [Adhaeribacter arboris]PSR52416.1 hypothetical protein AHMF7605_02195 [Adhaeribacter arboris]